MAYKIFYSGDQAFEEQPGIKPPPRDVQIIMQTNPNEPLPYFQSGTNYYVWKDEQWYGVDIFGLFDFLLETGLVLFGRTITNEEYQAIYQKAKGEKKTWKPGERK